jgi:hypothetical protein
MIIVCKTASIFVGLLLARLVEVDVQGVWRWIFGLTGN